MPYETPAPPPETPDAPQPRTGRRRPSRRAAWIGGGAAVLLALAGVTAAAVAPSGSGRASGANSTPTGGSADGAAGAGPSSGPRGAGTGGGASSGTRLHAGSTAVASAGPVALVHPKLRLAPAAARNSATAVLEADDSHYRQQLGIGESLLGKPGFAVWSTRILADTADRSDFSTADRNFTASDTPPALTTWRADNGAAVGAVQQFARDGGSGSTIASRTDAADALSYLTAADQLARQVGAGQ